MATLSEVTQILTVIMGSFPSAKPLDKNNFKAYHLILGDLNAEILKQAALTVAAENTFFPSAAEIRRAAFALYARADGVPDEHDAWDEVSRSFRTHGYYRGAPEWSHPIIAHAVNSVGGYTLLCTSDNPVADRAHFKQAYKALLARYRSDVALLPAVRATVERLQAPLARALAGVTGSSMIEFIQEKEK